MFRLLFLAILCLLCAPIAQADSITIQSGHVTAGTLSSTDVSFSLFASNFSFAGATGANSDIRGMLGDQGPGSRTSNDFFEGRALGLYLGFGLNDVSRFTVNGVQYYYSAGSLHFQGLVNVPVLPVGISTLTGAFALTGTLSGVDVSIANPLAATPVVFSFVGSGIATFRVQTFILNGQLHTVQLGGPAAVTYTFAVPEPESLVMLTSGALAFVGVLLRRKWLDHAHPEKNKPDNAG